MNVGEVVATTEHDSHAGIERVELADGRSFGRRRGGRAGPGARLEEVGQPGDAQRIGRRLGFVAHDDDQEERVGTEEGSALREDRRVDARVARVERGGLDADRLVRVGLDEEAIPGLVLRLEAASVLVDAGDHLGEVADERARRVHVADGGLRRHRRRRLPGAHFQRDGGKPGEEVERRRSLRDGRLVGAAAVQELAPVVVVRVQCRVGGVRVVRVACRRAAATSERGRDDAEVHVVDGRELRVARRASRRSSMARGRRPDRRRSSAIRAD